MDVRSDHEWEGWVETESLLYDAVEERETHEDVVGQFSRWDVTVFLISRGLHGITNFAPKSCLNTRVLCKQIDTAGNRRSGRVDASKYHNTVMRSDDVYNAHMIRNLLHLSQQFSIREPCYIG